MKTLVILQQTSEIELRDYYYTISTLFYQYYTYKTLDKTLIISKYHTLQEGYKDPLSPQK